MPQIELDELAGEEGGMESYRLAKFWRDQIDKMGKDKRFLQFIKRGHKVEARYRDERNKVDEDSRRRYSALWSNFEILKPALYGKSPVPIAERRFGDKDPIARGAAQILERALRNEIEICGFHESLDQAVNDYLLPGRGTVWVRYEPEFSAGVSLHGENSIDMKDSQGPIEPEQFDEEIEGSNPTGEKLEETNDEIVRESTPIDYIHWEDFLIFPVWARTWAEVVAVGKRVYMTYTQMSERFGRDIAKKIPLQKDERRKDKFEDTNEGQEVKGEVFEIWSKQDLAVFWVAEGYDYLLDRKDDPLNLEGFFPCPRPIIANKTNGTLIPVADYIEYQDQATQIDELSQRIAMLTRACKVAGVYNAAAKGVQRLLNESVENELIPVDDWAAFADKQGIPGQISFLPLKEIIGVINELTTLKEKQIEEMDRLTGINDLMRGTSDARETLGGVRLKANNTGTRLTARQNEVARFARDTVRIMADIMCQHFSPKSLVEASGAMFEEGLGVDVEYAQNEQAAQQPLPQKPPLALPLPGQPGQAPQAAGPPQGPPGQNVVPFPQRPGAVPGQTPSAPPPPQAPPVAPGLPAPPPPNPQQVAIMQAVQRIQQAIGLLRDERMRGFRVDIEVDSTIFGDAAQEKGDRTEFIAQVTKYLETATTLGAQVPEMTPLLGKLLQFGVRGFRVGRDLEASIEDFCDQAVKIAKAKQAQAASQPNPEQIKAQAQAMQAQATAQAAHVRGQADIAKGQADIQAAQLQGQADQQKATAEIQKSQMDARNDQVSAQMDIVMKQMELRMRQMEMQIEAMRAKAEVQVASENAQSASLGNQAQMHQASEQTRAQMHSNTADVAKTKIMADKPAAFMNNNPNPKPNTGAA